MEKKMRKKVFWTRLSAVILPLILISIFSFGAFVRVAEAQGLPLPNIASISPNVAEQGQIVVSTISGMHFVDGVRLSFSPVTGINATPVIFVSPMELRVTITIAKDAPIGPRDVIITNPDGQNGTLEAGFTVTEAKPTIDVVPPPAITGLNATNAHDGKVDLSWNPATADDFQYYAIYISETAITDVTGLSPIIKITNITVHNYTATGLKDNTTYWFAVTAVDISGNENTMISSISATPTPSIVPAPRIEVSGIVVTPLQPKVGDNVTFNASIANTGTAIATNVTINLKLDDKVVYAISVDIPAGSSIATGYSWQAVPGEHRIVVEVTDANRTSLVTSPLYIIAVEAAGLTPGVGGTGEIPKEEKSWWERFWDWIKKGWHDLPLWSQITIVVAGVFLLIVLIVWILTLLGIDLLALIGGLLTRFWGWLWPLLVRMLAKIGNWIEKIPPQLRDTGTFLRFIKVITALASLVNTNIIEPVKKFVKKAAEAALEAAKKIAEAALEAAKKAAEAALEAAKKAAEAALEAAKKAAEAIKDAAKKVAEAIKDAAKKVVEAAKKVWGWLFG